LHANYSNVKLCNVQRDLKRKARAAPPPSGYVPAFKIAKQIRVNTD